MNKRLNLFFLATALAVSFSASAIAQSEDEIEIRKNVNLVIPVSVTGFSGEVDSVIKFDLSVLGMEIVSPSEAMFEVSGNNNGRVEGRLVKKDVTLFSRAYQSSSTRSSAHAFAEDVVKAIRGLPGIFHSKIAYRVEKGEVSEVGMADFDGFNPIQLTHDNSMVNGPAWVPGQRKLLYASWKGAKTQIYAYNLNTGDLRVFANQPGSSFSPAVSPDGTRVAFISNKSGISPNLYVANMDGSGIKQLTNTREEDSSPCWSPDGSKICYASGTRAVLCVIPASGGTARRLTTALVGGKLTEPDWSPDGTQIIFTSLTGGFNICVVPAAGGEAKVLASGEDPCWAPNSRTVIFNRRENGRRVLSLLDVPTKHVKDVRNISGSCSQPAWAR